LEHCNVLLKENSDRIEEEALLGSWKLNPAHVKHWATSPRYRHLFDD